MTFKEATKTLGRSDTITCLFFENGKYIKVDGENGTKVLLCIDQWDITSVEELSTKTEHTSDKLKEAIEITIKNGIGGASILQRKMDIGHNEATVLIAKMEKLGVVGKFNATEPRDVLVKNISEVDFSII